MRLRALFALVSVVAATLAAVPPAKATAARPNVLLIVTDDQRRDQMAVMRHATRLFASEGRAFTNAFAQTPLCCPSRASILTGKYTHNHRVRGNSFEEVRHFRSKTVQHALRDAGYRTGVAGKFFNGWYLYNNPPGFDRWAIMRGGYYNTRFNVDGNVGQVAQHSTEVVAQQALRMLDEFQRDPSRPWFLYVAPFAPHWPYTPLPADASAVVVRPRSPAVAERDTSDKPQWVREKRGITGRSPDDVWAAQARALLVVDRMIQQLFTKLDRRQDTLAIFLSDNGYLLGEHGVSEDKRLPYPESVRIPLYVRWPGRVSAGSVDGRLALNADVAMTIVDAVGLGASALPRADGRSLLGLRQRDAVFLEAYSTQENPTDRGYPSWRSIVDRSGQQYTEWRDATGVLIRRELYGADDTAQMRNLFVTRPLVAPARAGAMPALLQLWQHCAGRSGPRACP